MTTPVADKLRELDVQRQDIEKQIASLNRELAFYMEKNYHKSLVDSEGFPREDLDFGELSTYRNLKRKWNELNYDYKKIMEEIEKNLGNLHTEYQTSGQAERDMAEYDINVAKLKKEQAEQREKAEQMEEEQSKESNGNVEIPFAEITEVTDESPAMKAGVQLGDLIVDFNSVNHYNHNQLKFLAETVKKNINQPLKVQVLRKITDLSSVPKSSQFYFKENSYVKHTLELVPCVWKGQGVLGCRFKEIS